MLFLIIIPLLFYYLYNKLIKPHSFWKDKHVVHVKPTPIFGCNLANILQRESFTEILERCYKMYPNERYVGFYNFTIPGLIIRDLDLIKQITVKDFDHFQDHSHFSSNDVDPLWSKNLFASRGEYWRTMRPTLSPAFTSSKMKSMFVLIRESAEQFTQYLLDKEPNLMNLEMKDVFTRFTNDVIATCAFGVKCDSLAERENEFYLMGKEATDFSGVKGLKFLMAGFCPGLMKLLRIKFFNNRVSSFFRKLVKDTMDTRERNNIIRQDMIHLLMEAKKGNLKHEQQSKTIDAGFARVEESDLGKSEVDKIVWTDDDITAQALIFFFAGFDTTSNLMSFLAYELALNPDIQQRLYEEVKDTDNDCGGKLTYEAVLGMKYMDMVVSETLRKWPPTSATDRRVTKAYTIPPVGVKERPLHLEVGTIISIAMYSIQRDPKNFPNPDKFDPERFSEENRSKINPTSMLAFGIGPRNCIGSRFALLENKTMFYHILKHFEFVITEKSPVPFVLSKIHFNVSPEGGMWLGLKKRTTT